MSMGSDSEKFYIVSILNDSISSLGQDPIFLSSLGTRPRIIALRHFEQPKLCTSRFNVDKECTGFLRMTLWILLRSFLIVDSLMTYAV